jgi:glyoxylase-like metal-dependent hydrolase (beta-lactamase superfamily II)
VGDFWRSAGALFEWTNTIQDELERSDVSDQVVELVRQLADGITDDSVAFHHVRSRVLLSGDAILSTNGMAWCTPDVVDRRAADTTNSRLAELHVDHLLPGHGRAVSGTDVIMTAVAATSRPAAARALRRPVG